MTDSLHWLFLKLKKSLPYQHQRKQKRNYGIWLRSISTSNNFCPQDYSVNGDQIPHRRDYMGFHDCIIALACATELISKHTKKLHDLQNCSQIPAATVQVKLADQLLHLVFCRKKIAYLSFFNTKAEASITLNLKMRKKLTRTNQRSIKSDTKKKRNNSS